MDSLLQAYHVFRHLGCHEVFVGPRQQDAFGIISRKVCACRIHFVFVFVLSYPLSTW